MGRGSEMNGGEVWGWGLTGTVWEEDRTEMEVMGD